jgi:hypothetical protein
VENKIKNMLQSKKIIKELDNRNQEQSLLLFEKGILKNIESYGLPINNILVPLDERMVVFKNIETPLLKIHQDEKINSIYFSKFLAAVAVGLFDAALNYLWDETISAIRKRVIQYDVYYFYDNATTNDDKRKKLKTADDITDLDDSELIQGARNIGLISELGYKHLDFIRFMRNWASAAHPNQNQLTGLQLISWLETCIKEVISLPLSNIVVETQQLLKNIKNNEITDSDAKKIATFFVGLDQQQVNNLSSGFLGIYLDSNTSPITSQNIHYLLPFLWGRVDENTRKLFGIKYGKFLANNDADKSSKVRAFLDIVNGFSYIPENIKVVEIEMAVQNLLNAHNGINNFYSEPIFARQLYSIIGEGSALPEQVRKDIVLGIVKVFLTNGNGVANIAEPYYVKIIKQFNQKEALMALLSFTDEQIANRLRFSSLCVKKYMELLGLVKVKLSAPAIRELFEEIEKNPNNIEKIIHDSRIKRMIENVQIILNS